MGLDSKIFCLKLNKIGKQEYWSVENMKWYIGCERYRDNDIEKVEFGERLHITCELSNLYKYQLGRILHWKCRLGGLLFTSPYIRNTTINC